MSKIPPWLSRLWWAFAAVYIFALPAVFLSDWAYKHKHYGTSFVIRKALSFIPLYGHLDRVVAYMYANGLGVEKNEWEAFKLFRSSAEDGDVLAQTQVGHMYAKGRGVTKDEKEAIKWYQLAAEKADAGAESSLGFAYANGRGVPQDYKQALKWYRLAADHGSITAQNNLGVMAELGQGVPQDYKEAMKWYRLAADKGDETAQKNIGQLYEYGKGVPTNPAEAFIWYKKAAENGDAPAQLKMANHYYDLGGGANENYAEAAKWYRLAAEQENSFGQFRLGWLHDSGKGVAQDDKEAIKWYRTAAAVVALAQNNLGAMYESGRGVPVSKVAASALYLLSMKTDPSENLPAGNFGRLVKQGMSPKEMSDAQALAKEMAQPDALLKSLDQYVEKSKGAETTATADTSVPSSPPQAQKKKVMDSTLSENCRPTGPSIRCQSQCVNGNCVVTYENGCKVRVRVKARMDPFTSQWTYPSPGC